MQILFKGLEGKTLVFVVKPSDTIGALRQMIEKVENVPPEQQRLIYKGWQLAEDLVGNARTLEDCNIQNQSILYLLLRLRGD
jgi:ubiquitin C